MAKVESIPVPLIPRISLPTIEKIVGNDGSVGNKDLVKFILEHAERFDWTLQGLGMLRMYLDKEQTLRLHIWHPEARMEGASELHTHPWSFHSLVVAGVVRNWRYREVHTYTSSTRDAPYVRQQIHCGMGGGIDETDEPHDVVLHRELQETYGEGQTYWQDASEIHRSDPLPGTVTIIKREFGEDRDHAYVYWLEGQRWETAEPRIAEPDEVNKIVGWTLKEWFDVD